MECARLCQCWRVVSHLDGSPPSLLVPLMAVNIETSCIRDRVCISSDLYEDTIIQTTHASHMTQTMPIFSLQRQASKSDEMGGTAERQEERRG